jgi:hypothetical protein
MPGLRENAAIKVPLLLPAAVLPTVGLLGWVTMPCGRRDGGTVTVAAAIAER